MFQNATSTVKTLFYINVFVFLITLLAGFSGLGDQFMTTFALFNYRSPMFMPWQLITHMFMHGGLMHILFNMLALVSLAPLVESSLGSRKFLTYYLICGLSAAFLHMFLIPSNVPLVGASGAIYGIAMIFSCLFPNEKLYFMFIPIGIRAKYLMPILFLIEIYCGFFFQGDGIGHFAHVGGGLAGLLLFYFDGYLSKKIPFLS